MVNMEGKVGVVFGVANKRSIAWAIAQALSKAGMRLAITYQNERLEQEARGLIAELPGAEGFRCDVSQDADIDQLFAQLKEKYGRIDTLVLSEAFRIAHDVSVYSLIALARAVAPLMTEGGSIQTLTYYGSTRVIPEYNVMGVAKASLEATVRYLAFDLGQKNIRVNAISAGPIKTLAARGALSGIGEMMKVIGQNAPLRRNIEVAEVAKTAVYLASDLSSGVTGEVIYVDCGYNIMGF